MDGWSPLWCSNIGEHHRFKIVTLQLGACAASQHCQQQQCFPQAAVAASLVRSLPAQPMASHIGKRGTVKPPERGIFPLDHDGECKALMKLYVACLGKSDADHFRCRTESGNYLKCRMDKDLMATEDLKDLGLGDANSSYVRVDPGVEKETKGFLAGTGVRPSNKWW